jgi:hypothetical protein
MQCFNSLSELLHKTFVGMSTMQPVYVIDNHVHWQIRAMQQFEKEKVC